MGFPVIFVLQNFSRKGKNPNVVIVYAFRFAIAQASLYIAKKAPNFKEKLPIRQDISQVIEVTSIDENVNANRSELFSPKPVR